MDTARKSKTAKAALIYAVILELFFVGVVPFRLLVFKNIYELWMHSTPESWYNYHDGGRKVITKKGIKYTKYYNNTTKEKSDGTKLRVPPGSEIEVAIVNMCNYPDEPAMINTAFYECDSGVYTLWGGIPFEWIENPEEIIKDLDAQRAKEAADKKLYTAKMVIGLVLTVVIAAGIVFLLWKLFKKREEFHYLFIALYVFTAVMLYFFVLLR